jgi:hypothetical protein
MSGDTERKPLTSMGIALSRGYFAKFKLHGKTDIRFKLPAPGLDVVLYSRLPEDSTMNWKDYSPQSGLENP